MNKNTKRILPLVISLLTILLSLGFWISYLFFYQPRMGFFILIPTMPLGIAGTVSSLLITKQRKSNHAGIILMLVNLFFAFSFFYPLIISIFTHLSHILLNSTK